MAASQGDKFLFVSYSGVLGGAERILLDVAGALPAVHEIFIACPEGPLASAAQARGLRVLLTPVRELELRGSALTSVAAARRLASHALESRRLITDLDPAYVVAWGLRSALALAPSAGLARRRGARMIFQHNDFLPGAPVADAVRLAAAHFDRVITLSEASAAELVNGDRLRTRTVAVAPSTTLPPKSAPAPEPRTVLVLGALVAWKRPDLALAVMARICERRDDVRLRFVGAPLKSGDPFAERLQAAAALLPGGSVSFAGSVPDPWQELAGAYCLLHCAPREPFGMAVLEGMAAGRPVVVPDAAGPREIVAPGCGLLYPPGDVSAAAEAILSLLDQPERGRAMGDQGRARARLVFSPERSQSAWQSAVGLEGRGEKGGAHDGARSSRDDPAVAVAVVTVTHNSAAYLPGLLGSLARHLPDAEVVTVDSASSDASVAVATSAGANVLALSENVGFGTACNRGLELVRAPVVILLNPDVELIDSSLLSCVSEAARTDRPERLLAPLVLRDDGHRQDSVHPHPTSAAALAFALMPPTLLPRRLAAPLAPWRSGRPRRAGWAVGCALVVKTETLRRLGGFDERIFMYGEDTELGLRAAAAGVRTWFWPTSRILHHGAHSTTVAFGGEPLELLLKARRVAVGAALGPRGAALDTFLQGLTFADRVALRKLSRRPAERERSQLRALRRGRLFSGGNARRWGP